MTERRGKRKRRKGRGRRGKKGYRRDSFADEDPKMTNSSLDLFPTVNRAHQPKGRWRLGEEMKGNGGAERRRRIKVGWRMEIGG